MANDRMKLELLLKAVDQMSGVIKKQSPLIKELDKNATKAYNSLKKLFSLSPKNTFTNFGKQSAAEFRKADTAANKLKRTLESVGKINVKSPRIALPPAAEIAPRGRGTDQRPRDERGGGRSTPDGQRELDKIYGRRSNKYIDRLADFNDRVLEPTREVKNVWKEQYDSLKPYVEETKKLYRAQEKFKLFDLPEAENKKAFDSIRQVVKEVRGANLADATEDFIDLFTALGDVSSATQALPFATRYRTNFTALYSDQFSDKEIGQQIQGSFKFAEMIGATIKGRAETERVVDVLSKISNSTGGRVTGVDFLAMAKTGKTAVKNLSTEGLMNISSLMEETGSGNTGTSLMSLYQALVGGTMAQESKERFDYFGLIDKSKIEYGKAQKIKKLKPGANLLGDLMQEDPLKAADKLREAMRAKGVNVDDAKAVDDELSILFKNRNAQALMSQLINQRDQIVKEADRARKAKGVLGIDKQLADSELKKIQEFDAALKKFKTEAGKPLLEVGTKIASNLTPLLEIAAQHPKLTQFALAAMVFSKGINGLGQTASILNSVSGGGLTSFFRNGAASANNATTAINGTSKALSSVKGVTSITLRVGALIGLGLAIDKAVDEATKAAESKKTAKESIATSYKAWADREKELNANSQIYIQKDFDERASTVWASLMGLGLKEGLYSERKKQGWASNLQETWMYPITRYSGAENKFTDDNDWGRMKNWAAQANPFYRLFGDLNNVGLTKTGVAKGAVTYAKDDLSDSRVMAAFLRQLPERVKDKGDQETIKQGLQQQFPESFAAAMRELAGLNFAPLSQAMTDIAAQSNASKQHAEMIAQIGQTVAQSQQPFSIFNQNVATLGDTSGRTNIPLGNLAGSAGRASSSIDGFAGKIANFQMPTPKVQTFSIGVPASNPASSLFGNNIFGRARGGSMTRGHEYRINEIGQEFFTPATSGSMVPNDAFRNRRKSNSTGVVINFNPTISVNSDNPNSAQLMSEIRRELVLLKREFEAEFSPDRLAQKTEYAAQRDSERL